MTANVARAALGISPSAWEEAQTILGEAQAAVVVACILQRGAQPPAAGPVLPSKVGAIWGVSPEQSRITTEPCRRVRRSAATGARVVVGRLFTVLATAVQPRQTGPRRRLP